MDAGGDDAIVATAVGIGAPAEEITTVGVVEGGLEPFCVVLDGLDHFFFIFDMQGECHCTTREGATGELSACTPAHCTQGLLSNGVIELEGVKSG